MRHFLRGQRDQIGIGRRPQAVVFEAEIFKTDTSDRRIGHHFGRPAAEILHAADLHLAVVDIDPVVGEQIIRPDHQRDGQKVAIFQVDARAAMFAGSGWIRADKFAHRRRADDMRRRR